MEQRYNFILAGIKLTIFFMTSQLNHCKFLQILPLNLEYWRIRR